MGTGHLNLGNSEPEFLKGPVRENEPYVRLLYFQVLHPEIFIKFICIKRQYIQCLFLAPTIWQFLF